MKELKLKRVRTNLPHHDSRKEAKILAARDVGENKELNLNSEILDLKLAKRLRRG